MKKFILGIVAMSVLPLLIMSGCSNNDSSISAKLGTTFELPAGGTVSIEGEDLEITFVEVINDSRCPKGAECIWEGEAGCRIDITHAGTTTEKILVQSGSSINSKSTFADYAITFTVLPYPELDNDIAPGDYLLEMIITK